MAGQDPVLVQRVIALWRETLGVEDIADDDDFFELGGSSITAIRLLPLVGEQFGVDLDADFVFQNRTPAEFADALREPASGRHESSTANGG